MFAKKFILITLCLLIVSPQVSFARVGKMATQEELDKYCIKVIHKSDGKAHYFVVALIEEFNDNGFIVKWGKKLEKRNFIKREDILNWEECYLKYKEIKGQ